MLSQWIAQGTGDFGRWSLFPGAHWFTLAQSSGEEHVIVWGLYSGQCHMSLFPVNKFPL